MHPVSVFEEGGGFATTVNQQAVKSAVQSRGKSCIFFSKMNKIRSTLDFQIVPLLP